MSLPVADLNWIAVAAAIVLGQVISTVWFVVIFAEPWAKEYGAASAKEHTSQIPGYTYGISVLTTVLLTLGIALLHKMAGISGLAGGLTFGVFLALCFCVPSILPGQAFLKRLKVFAFTGGSQSALMIAISTLLGVMA